MKNKKNNYRIIEESRLVYLLELEQLVDRLGFGSSVSRYNEVKKAIRSLSYVQDELEKYEVLSGVLKEVLDAENVFEVSDEEKEDMLYTEEFDSCGCCDCDYEDDDDFEDNDDFDDEDEVEGAYVIVYLEEEEDDDYEEDDYDEDDWADEFDDFYSDSLENSIFKEMENFVNGKYVSSVEKEEEEDTPDQFIAGPQLYEILKDYFKQIFE